MTSRYSYKSFWKRVLAALFDIISGLFAVFGPRKSRRVDQKSIHRILLIRLDHLGDVVLSRPAMIAVREHFKRAEIDLLVSHECAPLVSHLPGKFQVIPVRGHWFERSASHGRSMKTFFSLSRQLRSRRYDLAVDFRGDLRHLLLMRLSGIPFRVGYGITGGRFLATHSLDYPRHAHQSQVSEILLTRVGVPASDAPRSVRFDYSLAQQEMTLSKFPFLEDRAVKKIVIHTGAGYPSKKWPFEKFRQVINEVLNRELAAVILIGSREEKHANPLEEAANRKTYDLRGESGLEDLPVIVDFSNLYLGNDSGPGHIAAAQGGPVLILFSGVNRSEIWRPVGPGVNLIRHEVPCSPCEMPVCPLKHQDCMNKIELDAVMNQITIMLSEKKGQLHV